MAMMQTSTAGHSPLVTSTRRLRDCPSLFDRAFLARGALTIEKPWPGIAWLDIGTYESRLQASEFVQVVESCQGFKIACPRERACHQGYIDVATLNGLREALPKCP